MQSGGPSLQGASREGVGLGRDPLREHLAQRAGELVNSHSVVHFGSKGTKFRF